MTGDLVAYYEKSLAEEKEPSLADVVKVYEEASVLLGDAVRKRLADVEEFHRSLVRNRRAFLEGELARLQRQTDGRDGEVKALSDDRAGLMRILNTHRRSC